MPWVLLRGLTRETAHWGSFPDQLAKAFTTKVYCLDLPGCGIHHAIQSPTTIGRITDWLRIHPDVQAIPKPFRLLAVSLGAMVGWDWTGRYPTDIARAVFVNTSLKPFSPFYRRLQPHNYPTLARLIATSSLAAREKAILEMTSSKAAELAKVLPEWVEIQQRRSVSKATFFRQLTAAVRFKAQPLRSTPSVLLVSSDQDRLVHPSCSQAIARHCTLPLVTHPEAGHDLALDDPNWLIDTLLKTEPK